MNQSMSSSFGKRKKVLVICVDRDDDVGIKTTEQTPALGREKCLEIASKLALADPEDADSNTIFAAVKEFSELNKKGYDAEVGIITGKKDGGYEADRKIISEAESLTDKFHCDSIILVVDGSEDESIIEILKRNFPIHSIKRITIKHSRRIEESYFVLGKYIKLLIYEPKYSRFALGVPGLLLLAYSLMYYLGITRIAFTVSLIIIGGSLVIRGFDIGSWLLQFRSELGYTRPQPAGYIRIFSLLAGILISVASLYLAYVTISNSNEFMRLADRQLSFKYLPKVAGTFIQESINFLWLGLGTYFSGSALSNWLKNSPKIARDLMANWILILLYMPILQFSLIITGTGDLILLLSSLLLGIGGVSLGVTVSERYSKTKRRR